MTIQNDHPTRLTLTLDDGTLKLRLKIRLRLLATIITAIIIIIATLSGSPALLAILARLAAVWG